MCRILGLVFPLFSWRLKIFQYLIFHHREQLIERSAHLTTLSQQLRYLPLAEPLLCFWMCGDYFCLERNCRL